MNIMGGWWRGERVAKKGGRGILGLEFFFETGKFPEITFIIE